MVTLQEPRFSHVYFRKLTVRSQGKKIKRILSSQTPDESYTEKCLYDFSSQNSWFSNNEQVIGHLIQFFGTCELYLQKNNKSRTPIHSANFIFGFKYKVFLKPRRCWASLTSVLQTNCDSSSSWQRQKTFLARFSSNLFYTDESSWAVG